MQEAKGQVYESGRRRGGTIENGYGMKMSRYILLFRKVC